MTYSNYILPHVQEYYRGKDNYLYATVETVEPEDTSSDQEVEVGNALKLQFKDIHKESNHQELLSYLQNNGLDVEYLLGNGNNIIVFKISSVNKKKQPLGELLFFSV